jgi:hypothetical protein
MGHYEQQTPTSSGVIDERNKFVKSSPSLLFQRREPESSPFGKGGKRGIFFDRFVLFIRSRASSKPLP